MSDRHEALVLLAVLGERWDEAARLRRRGVADPAAFADLARRCDVHPQVHARLVARDAFDLAGGTHAERQLGEMRRKVQRDNLLLLACVEPALDLLLAAGIVPIALKGMDTLHRFHARFDERTLEDADLLVSRRDLPAALLALERGGWTAPPEPARTHWLRSSFEIPLRSPGEIPVHVELHWSLGQARRYRVDDPGLFRRAAPLEVAGRRILRLDDHDGAAHLLLHHVQHYFDRRLKWALDLDSMSRGTGFDWGVVVERVRGWDAAAAAGWAALHLERLFPGLVPASAREALPVAAWRRAATLPLRSSHPLDLFRWTRARPVQLWLAASALERPLDLPGYLLHRATRDRRDSPP